MPYLLEARASDVHFLDNALFRIEAKPSDADNVYLVFDAEEDLNLVYLTMTARRMLFTRIGYTPGRLRPPGI